MVEETAKPAATELRFDRSVYSVGAIKRAAYELMPRLAIHLQVTETHIVCSVSPVSDSFKLDDALHEFEREVLDQDLRISLEKSTEPLRTAILGLAFSRSGLQDG